jgi:hypothetical protein
MTLGASFTTPSQKPSTSFKPKDNYTKLWVYTEDAQLKFDSLVAEGTINITGGGGGWESVAIPQDSPISVWRGAQAVYTMEIPLVFDVIDAPDSLNWDVEDRCRTLEQMYGALTSPATQPPVLILNANGAIPNDVYNFPPLRWVISEPPTWGDQLRDSNGRRVQQFVTVKFMKYSPYDELTRNKSVRNAQPSHTVIAKGNDTYNKIAARSLKHDGGIKWGNRLAQLNGAKDGAAKVLPGTLVKLPTASQIKTWQHSSRR